MENIWGSAIPANRRSLGQMSTNELKSMAGTANGSSVPSATPTAPKIKSVEYFRVKPRWLFVKICDDQGGYGWGEATLEGHSLAVEGALDEIISRIIGYEAEYELASVPS